MGKQIDFVVTDRRGKRSEEAVMPSTPKEPIIEAPKDTWKDVAFMTAFAQSQQGLIPVGRAVGVRADDRLFVADWAMPPHWTKGTDWMALVQVRLDTFLNCECTVSGPCTVHRLYLQQWSQADSERIQRLMAEPMPLAIETLIRAEQSRQQSQLVVPGR